MQRHTFVCRSIKKKIEFDPNFPIFLGTNTWHDPPVSHVFVPIHRALLEREGNVVVCSDKQQQQQQQQ